MKMQLTVRTFTGGVSIVAQSDWAECTQTEFDDLAEFSATMAKQGHYMTVANTIIPGEFLRNHCVIDVRSED
jgi:hypothetical protein